MIDGYPYERCDSFFAIAAAQISSEGEAALTVTSKTFGGFPVTRAIKYLAKYCIDPRPDAVVVQFASSDLVVLVRRRRTSISSASGLSVSNSVNADIKSSMRRKPSILDWCHWQLKGLIGDLLGLPSITPLETYLYTMQLIVAESLKNGIMPIILSPFVFGGRRSDRIALAANLRLRAIVEKMPGAIYVDAYSALNAHSRRKMLLNDGMHLSLEGHRVVSDVLTASLKKAICARKRESA
jgi:hypothetical protein